MESPRSLVGFVVYRVSTADALQ